MLLRRGYSLRYKYIAGDNGWTENGGEKKEEEEKCGSYESFWGFFFLFQRGRVSNSRQLTTLVCVGSGSRVCFVRRLCGVTQTSPEETHLEPPALACVSGCVWGEEATATVSLPPPALRAAHTLQPIGLIFAVKLSTRCKDNEGLRLLCRAP